VERATGIGPAYSAWEGKNHSLGIEVNSLIKFNLIAGSRGRIKVGALHGL
jgi:hypothetical protein